MPTLTDIPLWLQDGAYSARLDRQFVNEVWKEGVLRGLIVSAATAFTVNVSAGAAVIQGDDQPNQGKYLAEVGTAILSLAHDPPPGTGSRIDLVVIRIYDPNAGAIGGPSGTVEVVRGTAGGSPTAPALPASSVELARVTLVAGDVSISAPRISTANRPTAAPVGGIGVSTAALIGGSPADGDMRYVTDAVVPTGGAPATDIRFRPITPGLYVYDAPRWTPPWNMPWGIMGLMQRMTDAGPVGGPEVSIAGLSVQFTSVAGRRYRVTFSGGSFASGSTDSITFIRLVDGVTGLAVGNCWNNQPGYGTLLYCEAYHAPAAGGRDYYVRCGYLGSGNATIIGRSDAPMTLCVEDIGPSGQPV